MSRPLGVRVSPEEISELNVRTRYDTYSGVAQAVQGDVERYNTYRQRLQAAMESIGSERLVRRLRVGDDGLMFQSGDASATLQDRRTYGLIIVEPELRDGGGYDFESCSSRLASPFVRVMVAARVMGDVMRDC